MIPEKFGRYEIIAELGKGGMATVYHANDPRFGRDVAIKVLPREFLHNPQFKERFEREAQTIATLEHSAIVPVYDFGEENGQPFLVMRYMSEGTLASRLKQGPLEIGTTLHILRRIAAALEYAHSRGMVHRDLKPGNILFDQHGDAFLADFGLVKISEATVSLTGSNIIGTPAYMSPEQATGDQPVDLRSDIYALGIILYEMLSGQVPYLADSPVNLLMKHVLEPVPRILDVKPDLPPEYNQIITRALAKSPDDRYPRATALVDALEQATTQVDLTLPSSKAVKVTQSVPKRSSLSGPVLGVMGAIVLVVGLVVTLSGVFNFNSRNNVSLPTESDGVGESSIEADHTPANGQGSIESTSSSSNADKPTPLAQELTGTTVTIVSPHPNDWQKLFERSMQPFEDRTGINVIHTSAGAEFETFIAAQVKADDPPDIVAFPQPGLLADYVHQGEVIDVRSFLDDAYLKEHYADTFLELVNIDGIVAGVWYDAGVKSLVWYPKEEFDAAGYKVPQTWEQLIELSDQMVADGRTPWCIGIEDGQATGWIGTDWVEDILLRTATPQTYDAWVKHELPFDSPEVRRAFELMERIWFNDDYVYGGRAGILTENSIDNPIHLFEDPPGCYLYKQGSFAPGFFFPKTARYGEDYDFFYLPPIDPEFGNPVLGNGVIYAMFNDRPEVREVMRYLTKAESAKALVEAGGFISAHKDTPLSWYPTAADLRYAQIVLSANTFRFDGSDLMPGEVGSGSFWQGIADWANGADLETVLQDIDKSWPQ
ncbi:MAG: extracellular solute-binding protein [Anaerolineales bacterium]|nr:extracellular solute-binding protein [Anaerolineales bacterium]